MDSLVVPDLPKSWRKDHRQPWLVSLVNHNPQGVPLKLIEGVVGDNVTRMTLNRDMNDLEQQGMIRREYRDLGMVWLLPPIQPDQDLPELTDTVDSLDSLYPSWSTIQGRSREFVHIVESSPWAWLMVLLLLLTVLWI